ncbi:MAG: hypothetical protein PHH48_07055 [Eubacteriales bacterium]|nr:hypothetical protein [Eubacteriales bacterium]
MNKHFPVINKKGVILTSIFTLIIIVAGSFSIVKVFTGSSMLWILPSIVFIALFIISIMMLISILTAGIDINDNIVTMPDLDPSKGKQPKFDISQLKSIELRNGNGEIINEDIDSMYGARIVFILDNNSEEIYYPVYLTPKQYKKIKEGMISEGHTD